MVYKRTYKSGELTVRTVVSAKTGYGWLAYRAFIAFPKHIPLSVYVLPPRDALLIYGDDELRADADAGRATACLFAIDGTEIPESWLRAQQHFDYYIIMLDHNDFARKCGKIIGEFYPKPRTLVWLERNGIGAIERNPKELLLGTVAHGHARKNIELIVTIAHEFYKRADDVKFSIVTDARTAYIWRHYAPANTEFLVDLRDDEMVSWYSSLWAFFSLSSGEGGALPALEASILGVPTILPKHTAFAIIGASVFLTDLREVEASGDANIAGSLFIPNPREFIDIVRAHMNTQLPPPPPARIQFEQTHYIKSTIKST